MALGFGSWFWIRGWESGTRGARGTPCTYRSLHRNLRWEVLCSELILIWCRLLWKRRGGPRRTLTGRKLLIITRCVSSSRPLSYKSGIKYITKINEATTSQSHLSSRHLYCHPPHCFLSSPSCSKVSRQVSIPLSCGQRWLVCTPLPNAQMECIQH